MKVIVERSKNSQVAVNNKVVGKINYGMVILVGVAQSDTLKDIDYMINKIINLRIFPDENGIMNKNILETNGEVLSISQFTLLANTEKGNRPSYINAMKGQEAASLYDYFNHQLKKFVPVATGVFGTDILVSINNDGPVTICLDSHKKN